MRRARQGHSEGRNLILIGRLLTRRHTGRPNAGGHPRATVEGWTILNGNHA